MFGVPMWDLLVFIIAAIPYSLYLLARWFFHVFFHVPVWVAAIFVAVLLIAVFVESFIQGYRGK